MIRILLSICLSTVILSSSAEGETTSPPVLAQEAQSEKFLLIGLIPEQNIFKQVERYEPLMDYLSKKIGMRIKLKILTRYGNIVDNFVSLGMDGAFFGSFTYALARMKLGVEVLARPESFDGSSTYHGLIFARKDSAIKTVRDIKGKRFAFVDKATTAGFLLPLVYFKKKGVKDYKVYLKEAYFTGTHEDAIYDVFNKKADIGAAKNTIFERVALTDKRIRDELVVLEKSPDVPENGLAVRKTLEISIKNRLQETLLDMQNDSVGRNVLKNFGAQKFIRTTDRDYEPVFKYASEINLNLAQYDYMNE